MHLNTLSSNSNVDSEDSHETEPLLPSTSEEEKLVAKELPRESGKQSGVCVAARVQEVDSADPFYCRWPSNLRFVAFLFAYIAYFVLIFQQRSRNAILNAQRESANLKLNTLATQLEGIVAADCTNETWKLLTLCARNLPSVELLQIRLEAGVLELDTTKLDFDEGGVAAVRWGLAQWNTDS